MRARREAEAQQSRTDMAALAGTPEAVEAEDGAVALQRALLAQQAACNAVLMRKQALLAELRGVMQAQEEEYLTMLGRHAEQVDEMLLLVAHGTEALRADCARELAGAADAFSQVPDYNAGAEICNLFKKDARCTYE